MSDHVLLVGFYNSGNTVRNKELIFSLKENEKNDCISRIVVFNEADKNPIESDKITYVDVSNCGRVTYKDYFEYANEHLVGQRCILANADIVITEDIEKIAGQCLKNILVCLSRWDQGGKGLEMGADSQDTWIFDPPLKQELANEADYPFGVLFSDNVLSYLAHKHGYIPWNPSKDIKTKHVHNSRYRPVQPGAKKGAYASMEALKVTDGSYLLVHPTHIGDEIKIDLMGSTKTGRSR
jgi:hypothetical protein